MLCDICGKNEATIHINEIVNGHSKTINLCGECMAKNPALGGVDINAFNLAEIVLNLAGKNANKPESAADTPPDTAATPDAVNSPPLPCPHCGWTAAQLRKSGQMGCPGCYRHFFGLLGNALINMHRGTEHKGKQPYGPQMVPSDEYILKLRTLQTALNKSIKVEDYEQAAVLRDQIRELKENYSNNPQNGGRA